MEPDPIEILPFSARKRYRRNIASRHHARLLDVRARAGVGDLRPEGWYGLSIALGGAEETMEELAAKAVKGGQHIVPPEHTPLANVLLTMLDRVGITQDKLGDSTGKILEV